MARAGPKKIHRCSPEFTRTAVNVSYLDGVQAQAAAEAPDGDPFMLLRWGKEARDGVLRVSGGAREE